MATNNTTTNLDAYFKEVYADKINKLYPNNAKIVKAIPFTNSTKVGKKFNEPVALTFEHGITYALAGAGAFDINTPIAMTTENAEIDGSQILVASRMDYEAAAKASGGKQAFITGTKNLVETMLDSITKRLELSFLYGQSGYGKTSAVTAGTSVTTTVTISAATWSIGIWAGLEGAKINFYDGASLVSSSTDADFTITSINVDNRTLALSGSSTGITALNAAIGTTGNALDIYFKGSYGAECAGLDKIITNTGTLFGISASTYSLWKGSSYDVGSTALTGAKFLSAVAKASSRGLNENTIAYINPLTWNNLLSNLSGSIRYTANYEMKMKYGSKSIEIITSSGMTNIIPHECVKQGEGFIIPENKCKRVGATDITFNNPGVEGKFFTELPTNAGFELRAYSHQAIYLQKPAYAVKMINIVNS